MTTANSSLAAMNFSLVAPNSSSVATNSSLTNTQRKVEIAIEFAMFLPLTLVALIGNSLVLAAIYRNPKLRRSAHYFIATLAVTDLLSACISQPLTLTAILSERWIVGTFGCNVHGFFNSYLTYTSSYTMVLTAINRYFNIVRPQQYSTVFTRQRVITLLVTIWLANFVVTLSPVLGGWARFGYVEIFRACCLRFPSNREASWAGFEFTVFSLIPMIVISVCYYRVSKAIREHNHNAAASFRGRNSSTNVEEIRVTKTLFSLVFVFFACMFIGFIMVVICRVVAGSILDPVGRTLIFLITLTTAINPILYTCTSKEFRKEFCLLLKCKKSIDVAPLPFTQRGQSQRHECK